MGNYLCFKKLRRKLIRKPAVSVASPLPNANAPPPVDPSVQIDIPSELPYHDQQKNDPPARSDVVIVSFVPKGVEDLRQMTGYGHVNIFTYNELRLVTRNFRPDLILGEGGFGLVYKGVIDASIRLGFQSTKVAVKELNPEGLQGDKEWLTEINYLGQVSHPNLVKLIGYCCEGEHRLLVYEYMACGSLEKHLFRRVSPAMSWSTRLKIALDAAKGLAFLHEAKRPIIYRDFKTSNILLDAEFNGKLSDFGLAKDGPTGEQTHVSTRVMGTYGYAAPEYLMTGHLTSRSDVYGFGVVLLEILIGERALDSSRPSQMRNLVEWARPLLIRSIKLLKIIDPRMKGQYSLTNAENVAKLAFDCLSRNPKGRPTMSEVVDILVQERQRSMLPLSDTDVAVLHELSEQTPHNHSRQTVDSSAVRLKHCSGNDKAQRDVTRTNRRRKRPNGRSRSEPSKCCRHSQDSNNTQPDENTLPNHNVSEMSCVDDPAADKL